MKKQALFTGILFLAVTANAQIPGYLGKRLSASVNASSFLFIESFSYGYMEPRLSYKTEIGLNYALGRKADMGFHYYYGAQKYKLNGWLLEEDGNLYLPETEELTCRLQIFEWHLRFFAKNFLAPVGIYHQFGIAYLKYTVAPDTELKFEPYFTSYSPTDFILKAPFPEFSGIKLSYHAGRITPIGKLFFINSAIGINFFQSGDLERLDKSSLNESNYVRGICNKNLRRHNLAEIKIGFGVFLY